MCEIDEESIPNEPTTLDFNVSLQITSADSEENSNIWMFKPNMNNSLQWRKLGISIDHVKYYSYSISLYFVYAHTIKVSLLRGNTTTKCASSISPFAGYKKYTDSPSAAANAFSIGSPDYYPNSSHLLNNNSLSMTDEQLQWHMQGNKLRV